MSNLWPYSVSDTPNCDTFLGLDKESSQTILFCSHVGFPGSQGLCAYHATHIMPGTQKTLYTCWLNADCFGGGGRDTAQITLQENLLGGAQLTARTFGHSVIFLLRQHFHWFLPDMIWGIRIMSAAEHLSRPPLAGDSPSAWPRKFQNCSAV